MWHCEKPLVFCLSRWDNMPLFPEHPPLFSVNIVLPVRTPLLQVFSKTNFAKCLKTNKSCTNICICCVSSVSMFILYFNVSPPSLSVSLQLVLRAPSSHSRGSASVSNVRSTVALPSRLPQSAGVVAAFTAETWTNRRTCAPVSLSLCWTNKKQENLFNS